MTDKIEPTSGLSYDELFKTDVNKNLGGRKPGAPGKSGSGGYRPGSGRKKGQKAMKTILREEAAKELAEKALLKAEIIASLPPNLQRSERALKEAIKEINIEEIEEVFKKRVALHSNKLLSALLTSALGEQFLYKVVYATDELDNKIKRRHVRITDPEEIQQYLDDPLAVEGSDYYYISSKSPDITAINSLLDRMIGRPTTKVVGPNNADGSEGPIKVISVNYSPAPQVQAPQAPVQVISEVIRDVVEEQNGDSATT